MQDNKSNSMSRNELPPLVDNRGELGSKLSQKESPDFDNAKEIQLSQPELASMASEKQLQTQSPADDNSSPTVYASSDAGDAGIVGSQVTPRTLTPIAARDDDLIEKEWVDRAKAIVQETKEDPYKQEEEVSVLQADYLKKRYGRVVEVRQKP